MSDFDPFAAAPADEAQAAPAPGPFEAPPAEAPKTAGVTVPVTAKVTSVETEGKVVLTLKGGTGFDAPWIVIHATDLQDANEQVSGENAVLLVDTMTKLQAAGKKFVEVGGGKTEGARSAPAQRSNAPQPAQEAPGGEERFCSHGKMRFRSGVSKAGKPYSAFFCASGDRNDECKAQFLR